jgi:hypothetical protein
LPFVASADNRTLKDLLGTVMDYINQGIFLIIGLSVITFIWGVYKDGYWKKDSFCLHMPSLEDAEVFVNVQMRREKLKEVLGK